VTAHESGAGVAGAGYVVTRPSWFVKVAMGPMTKVLNPAMRRLAGRPHFQMAALVRHTGRRSGRQYVTPVGAQLAGNTIVIPLTFGTESDWSRNVRAAGGCSIRLGGTDYDAVAPEVVSAGEAKPVVKAAYSGWQRGMFRMLGIKQFLLLRLAAK
jgi:deazaflavin-dependent oxidoreductase (nitroreductase family)